MNITCFYCNWIGSNIFFEVDHKTPLSRGGSESYFNKRIICSGCNRQKGDKTESEYMLWRISNLKEANYGPNLGEYLYK